MLCARAHPFPRKITGRGLTRYAQAFLRRADE
eukprot:COSAG05_NODE_19192_length_296_cov_0.873096_1_plen_31_part_01